MGESSMKEAQRRAKDFNTDAELQQIREQVERIGANTNVLKFAFESANKERDDLRAALEGLVERLRACDVSAEVKVAQAGGSSMPLVGSMGVRSAYRWCADELERTLKGES